MKTVEMAEATGSLSDYSKKARTEPVVVTENGRPVVVLMPVSPHTDLENLAITTHPTFLAIMERSEARYRLEGGVSTEEMRRRLAARRKAGGKRRKAR